jgi:hypothetical protein
MRPVIRYQSQLLFRKSYKPNRVIRIRPGVKTAKVFRPTRRSSTENHMNANHIDAKFAAMGARFKLQPTFSDVDFAIDIQRARAGEFFQFRWNDRVRDSIDLTVLQTEPRARQRVAFLE